MSSKWIEVSSANEPAPEVARRAVAARLAKISRLLPLAAYQYQEDVEYVHHLRTSCRRAAAAVQAFRPLMSRKPKALRKLLQQIRNAAGPARDADVLLARCHEQSPVGLPDDLLARLELQRQNAQGALVQVARKYESGKLKKAVQRTLESLESVEPDTGQPSIVEFGRSALLDASEKVFQLTGIDRLSVPQLHELRIAGKRLRYSIELFHEVFAPELRQEIYPQVEQLQERLGQLNDHATAQAMYQSWLAELTPSQQAADLARSIIVEYDATIEVRREFLQWWTAQRDAALKSRLSELLQPTD